MADSRSTWSLASGLSGQTFRVLWNAPHVPHSGDNYGGYFAGFCGIGLTYTSDDGTFVVKDLVAGSVQRLSVMALGFGEGFVDRAFAEPENHLSPDKALTIQLVQPHGLRVRAVEDSSGLPIADTRVALIYDDPGIDVSFSWGYHDASWGDETRTRTGPDGWAEFPPVPFGEATLIVQAPGYGRRHQGWRDGAREVSLKLRLEAVLSGTIADSVTGKPLDGVHVDLVSANGEQISTLVTSVDDGKFQMTELPAGEYTLSVGVDFGRELHRDEVRLESGKTLRRSFRLSKSGPPENG